MTDLTHSAMLPCKEAAWLSGNTPKKCCKETVEEGDRGTEQGGGRNGPKKSWEEGEIGGKSREEGEKEKLGIWRIELHGPG